MATLYLATIVLLSLLPTSLCLEGFDLVFQSNPHDTPNALLSNQDGSRVDQMPKSALTFCFYTYLENAHDETATLVSYSSKESESTNEIYLEAVYEKNSYTALSIHGEAAVFHKTPNLDEWTHVCCSWSSSSGQVHLFFNGKKITEEGTEIQKGSSIGVDGFFVVGQDQDYYYGGFDESQAVKGRMTQLNVWDRVITQEEVNETMHNNASGAFIAWANTTWQLGGGIMVEKTTAPIFTSCGEIKISPCLNAENTFTSLYDLETGFDDGLPKNVTGTLKNVVIPELQEFSLCFYLYNELGTFTNQPITYQNEMGEPVITFGASSTPEEVYFGVGNNSSVIPMTSFPAHSVSHICETWSAATGELTTYKDGAPWKTFSNMSKDVVVPGNGKLIMTQEQYAPLNKENATNGFRYKMTHFYMWDRLLTDDEVASFENCTGLVKGYLVYPTRSEWEVETHGCKPHSKVSPIESDDASFKDNERKSVVLRLKILRGNTIEELKNFSFCFWAYSEKENPNPKTVIVVHETKLVVNNGMQFYIYNDVANFTDYSIGAGSWQHICITWAGADGGTTQLFVDGEKKGSAEGIGNDTSVPASSSWFTINKQYAAPDKEDPTKGFDWKTTDLNVWNYVLSETEVKQAQQCSLVLGNVITPRTSTWEIFG